MSKNSYYSDVINQIARRSVEATISILGITDKNLRQHLVKEMNGQEGQMGFLSDPVFESMFPWEKSNKTMDELSGSFLLPSLVSAMDKAGDHRFGRDWYPFDHQINAWNILLGKENKSLVVTSGTGSGKTECFMVPILNDLAKEYEQHKKPLIGVRALFVYPLNALINSQRERLRAWTEAYDDGLRFCLYNGNTEENKHPDQGKHHNEILTRKVLRDVPAPMLVTNATMLEYMLVRQVDEPILQQSQGKLRWIVLDEAHTYMGSQAAELSLLLRRVMHAFGVEAKDVRFVATSATIGDKDADKQLQEYLAKLSGVNVDQVSVVGGKRSVPELPKRNYQESSLDELKKIEYGNQYSKSRYDALVANKTAVHLRSILTHKNVPSRLSDLSLQLFGGDDRYQDTLAWIDLCSSTVLPGQIKNKPEIEAESFLPVRGHLFHQVLSGLWCCVNKHCSAKADTALVNDWPFGYVYSQRRNHCDCGAPVFELVFCNDCNSPHLLAIETGGYLIQQDRESVDEFSLDYEDNEDAESNDEINEDSDKLILAPNAHDELTYPRSIDKNRLISPPGMETYDLNALDPGHVACGSCEFTGFKDAFYRRSLLGTPFYISNTVPLLLEACQESPEANDRPNRGRRLITFTDSRQGTARLSTKIQQDSERDAIRGLIYRASVENVSILGAKDLEEKKKKIEEYKQRINKFNNIGEAELAKATEELMNNLTNEISSYGQIRPVNWSDALIKLQSSQDVSRWIYDYYKELNPLLFPETGGSRVLTEMLLLREFSRRPKRQNSMETLGLVSVQYPTLNAIEDVPQVWNQLGLTLSDWRDFLKVTLDFYIRENSIIDIPGDWVNWMGAKIYPKSVLRPDTYEATSSRVKRWPQVIKGRNNRIVRILVIACDLDLDNPMHVDRINSILTSAWNALTARYTVKNAQLNQVENRQILRNSGNNIEFKLSREEMAFQAVNKTWICPYTNRLLDVTFKGITPYLPFNANKADVICKETDMSICQLDVSQYESDYERKRSIRQWIHQQDAIINLRSENLWTDISDRIVGGGRFIRTVEHSAQQPASKLERYEALFKTGKLNVMSCSTTMEMGVDIGGISVVAMNNVPPHPANYLQRAGRAGRRGETQALSFTICKDNPHERSVYVNPLWPFVTAIAAPYITLNSDRIIQRHINSLLLSYFLKNVVAINTISVTSLDCEWFFGVTNNTSIVDNMINWMESLLYGKLPQNLDLGIKQIVKNSVLGGVSHKQIITRSVDALITIKSRWLPGYQQLKAELDKLGSISDRDPYKRKVMRDLKVLSESYLLSELAAHAYLPGYGFPTGIVTFDHYSLSDYKQGKYVKKSGRIDNMMRLRERPSRDIAVAMREYAPGADIVIDGLVYRSAGILLNKFSPNDDYSQPQRLLVEWFCNRCGFIGNESGALFNHTCSNCGATLLQENIREYIEPMGFAVDFYSSPSTDISTQAYVPVQEPWVTANTHSSPLYDPRLGSYRGNTEGHVFHHSSGEHGTGYAVCLRCGKAESMTTNNEYPENIRPGKPHLRLQGKSGPEADAYCDGPDEAYAIKDGVHLGATDQTDVVEIYLKHPEQNLYLRHSKHDQLPWTLAVVFRQALADIHGINADEMGYAVKPAMILDCNYPVAAIVLFDKNGGGAGFSSSASRYMQEIFVRAIRNLDCSDNCDSACQSCLMGYDTRFHIDLLNRHVALEYLNSLLPYLEMPEDAKLFGPDSKYCFESLTEEVLSAVSQGAHTIRIFTGGKYEDWDIGVSDLKDACINWRNVLKNVELVLPYQNVEAISDVHKEDLSALYNLSIKLTYDEKKDNESIKNGVVLVQLISDSKIITIGTNNKNASVPNIGWWDIDDGFLIKADNCKPISIRELDVNVLKINKSVGDIEVDVSSECDGSLNAFGFKLWESLCKHSESIRNYMNGSLELRSVKYTDCYISTPWSLMLLAEIVYSLKKQLKDRWDGAAIAITTGDKPSNPKPKGLYAEWETNHTKSDVIVSYFRSLGDKPLVSVNSIRDMPHGRVLLLEWSDNSKTYIRLDHGVGCWGIDKKPNKWFDIDNSIEKQVKDMLEIRPYLKVKYSKNHPTQIFIKSRK